MRVSGILVPGVASGLAESVSVQVQDLGTATRRRGDTGDKVGSLLGLLTGVDFCWPWGCWPGSRVCVPLSRGSRPN